MTVSQSSEVGEEDTARVADASMDKSVGTSAEKAVDSAAGAVLTAAAVRKVRQLLALEDRSDLRLRVAVQPGGCSGLRYQLFFDDRLLDGDKIIAFGDADVSAKDASTGSGHRSGYEGGTDE